MIIISQNGIIAARTLPACQAFFLSNSKRGLHSINQLFCLPLYSQLTAFRTRKKRSSDDLTCSHSPMAASRSALVLGGFPLASLAKERLRTPSPAQFSLLKQTDTVIEFCLDWNKNTSKSLSVAQQMITHGPTMKYNQVAKYDLKFAILKTAKDYSFFFSPFKFQPWGNFKELFFSGFSRQDPCGEMCWIIASAHISCVHSRLKQC